MRRSSRCDPYRYLRLAGRGRGLLRDRVGLRAAQLSQHAQCGRTDPIETFVEGRPRHDCLHDRDTCTWPSFDREQFALGAARLPIFLAGLCFTVAYAYGIIRYRLLLVDQIVTKGVMYYLASSGLTVAFALTIALGPLARQYLNIFPLTQQSALISVVLMLAVILLLWLRDVFQGVIDRRFYREKYQLGKALERMNRAVGHLADPEAVAELMLSSCRDVLGVDRAALYLRTSAGSPFRLVAAYGAENLPRQFAEDHPLMQAVKEFGNMQRALLGSTERAGGGTGGTARVASRPGSRTADRQRDGRFGAVGRESRIRHRSAARISLS